MKQKPIKSQTTQTLHPEQSFNLRPSRISIIIANAKDFGIFAVVMLITWFLLTSLLTWLIGG